MMYQCLVSSSAAGSSATAAPAAASLTGTSLTGTPGSESSGRLSMSGMLLLHKRRFGGHNGFRQNRIDNLEVRGEDKHAHDHHQSCRLHPLAARPRHPLHFAADVAQITPRVLDPALFYFQFASHSFAFLLPRMSVS